MHHAALDRPGPHDRDLDHQVVEACAASGAAASTSARAIRSGTRRRVGALDHVVDGADPRPGCPASRSVVPRSCRHHVERAADRRQHAEREHVDLEQAQRVEVVLVPLDDACARASPRSRPAPAASSRPRAITKPPTCCDRWRGKPSSCAGERDQRADHADCRDRSRASREPLAHDARGRPTTRTCSASRSSCCEVEAERLADVAQRAARPVADDASRRARRGRGRTSRRCTGSLPRAAGARSRRRCRAARCAPC